MRTFWIFSLLCIYTSLSFSQLGKWLTVESTSKNFGKNNLVRIDTTDDFLYYAGSGSIDVGNIDSNFWENGKGSVYTPPSSATDPPFDNVTYTSAQVNATSRYAYGSVGCSSGIPSGSVNKETNQKPQSVPQDTSCEAREAGANFLTHSGQYQKGYEAYQWYFEVCATIDENAWGAFTGIGSANSFRSANNSRFAEFREWLKKVLYYRPDTNYYCADVAQMLQTFYWFDSLRGQDHLGVIAVSKYVLESGKCSRPQDTAFFKNKGIDGEWSMHVERWQDTVKDPIATPLDSTLPTLEELDLEILFGPSDVAQNRLPRIGNMVATTNPFTSILELKYVLDKSAMTRIEIYDVLGKAVYSEGQGYKEQGEHSVSIPTMDWTAGSYYVRLVTPSGEVKTVNVIRE